MFDTGMASRPSAMAEPMLSRIWRFAWRLVGDQAKAESLVYRSCVEAHHRELTMDAQSEPALREMFAIVCAQWHTHFVRKQRLREASTMGAPPSHCADCEENTLFTQIRDATDALPDYHRIAVLLVSVEGFSADQAAAILGIPVQALVQRLVQARIEIGRCLLRKQAA